MRVERSSFCIKRVGLGCGKRFDLKYGRTLRAHPRLSAIEERCSDALMASVFANCSAINLPRTVKVFSNRYEANDAIIFQCDKRW